MLKKLLIATAAFGMAAMPAFAHITLERGETPVGSSYKAVFRVGHGCAGKATVVSPPESRQTGEAAGRPSRRTLRTRAAKVPASAAVSPSRNEPR